MDIPDLKANLCIVKMKYVPESLQVKLASG